MSLGSALARLAAVAAVAAAVDISEICIVWQEGCLWLVWRADVALGAAEVSSLRFNLAAAAAAAAFADWTCASDWRPLGRGCCCSSKRNETLARDGRGLG